MDDLLAAKIETSFVRPLCQNEKPFLTVRKSFTGNSIKTKASNKFESLFKRPLKGQSTVIYIKCLNNTSILAIM